MLKALQETLIAVNFLVESWNTWFGSSGEETPKNRRLPRAGSSAHGGNSAGHMAEGDLVPLRSHCIIFSDRSHARRTPGRIVFETEYFLGSHVPARKLLFVLGAAGYQSVDTISKIDSSTGWLSVQPFYGNDFRGRIKRKIKGSL